ncbi:helix-turn-helix transcriptional regulator [Streptomyces iconiensis]|uniref:Helix-turn-helix transcriptional regulator n=1 Tax=Streptomyces iconiensis TaxID=1384038 RepID=A0ABT7A2H7_9ACTN|nr:helix-turn-helix transcriptional regulator [Streptomyces iconiensis]MDJ1135542.1 helix-turn-helix transcriptional regulator [Streptomyces iconiensis]
MDTRAELREFLRSCRARISPQGTGPDGGPAPEGRSRVPGLRREEPARPAGMSVEHYVRLEQGRAGHVRPEVLDALARALRLDVGRRPDDAELVRLVGELRRRSEDFRRVWADHAVREVTHGAQPLFHPLVGTLQVTFETLRLPDDRDRSVVAHLPEPGTPAAADPRLPGEQAGTARNAWAGGC